MQPVTLKKIGDNLGVSKRLVGYALTGTGRVGAETKQRILTEAARLGYRPNRAARALTTGRSGLIALCLPAVPTGYCDALTRSIEAKVRSGGLDLIVTRMNDDFDRDPDLLPRGLSQVDGAFLLEPPKLPSDAERAMLRNIVIMGVRDDSERDEYDLVRVNLLPAAREAAQAVLRSRPRRFAYFTAYGWASETEARNAAYLDAVRSTGQDPIYIRLPEFDDLVEDAARAFVEFIAANPVPDAVMCSNDEVAMGVLRAVRDIGMSCPNDIVVTGCDGVSYTRDLNPSLSTIAQPYALVAEKAWEILSRRIADSEIAHEDHLYNAKFVERDSTKPLRSVS